MQVRTNRNIFSVLFQISSLVVLQEHSIDSLSRLEYQKKQELFLKSANDSLVNHIYVQAYLSPQKKKKTP